MRQSTIATSGDRDVGHWLASSSPARVGTTALFLAGVVALAMAPLAIDGSYSWVEHGTSESAGQGVQGAWVARSGFMLFGLAVLSLVPMRAQAWGVVGTICHVTFGMSLLAVAAFSARSWDDAATYVESEDVLHSVFATLMGFAFVIGVAAVMVARRLPSFRAALPDVAAVVFPTAISLMMSVGIWGLLQRVMFLTAALWYLREAWMPPRATPEPGT